MISVSHWGMFDVSGMDQIDGPAYADRVGGRLTFRDWALWDLGDQRLYQQRYLRSGMV